MFFFLFFLKTIIVSLNNHDVVKIVTFIDKNYDILLDNFYCNLKMLNLSNNLHVYYSDLKLKTFFIEKNISSTCLNNIKSSNSASSYGQSHYWYITKIKTLAFLKSVSTFENFIFSDVDVLWLQNPIPDLFKNCKTDICFQANNKNDYDKINSGFFYVKRTQNSMNFFSQAFKLVKLRKYIDFGDQDILNDLKSNQNFSSTLSFLCLDKYPNGLHNDYWGKNILSIFSNNIQVMVIHNNWIISLKEKINRYKRFNSWFVDKNRKCSIDRKI